MRTVAAAAAVVALGSIGASPARSADVEVGSWWLLQPDAGVVVPPPTVIPGSAWLASNPTGATAISAVRFAANPARPLPELVLEIASAQPDAEGPITACAASSPWEAVTAGAWSGRPAYDCSAGRVTGVTSLDGTTVRFDLALLDPRDVVDLVLFPSETTAAVPSPSGLVPGAPPLPPVYPAYDIVAVVAPPDVEPAGTPTTSPTGDDRSAGLPAATEPPPAVLPDLALADLPRSTPATSGATTRGAVTPTTRPSVAADLLPAASGPLRRTEGRDGSWRVALGIIVVVAGLEASRRLSTGGGRPLGGLRP